MQINAADTQTVSQSAKSVRLLHTMGSTVLSSAQETWYNNVGQAPEEVKKQVSRVILQMIRGIKTRLGKRTTSGRHRIQVKTTTKRQIHNPPNLGGLT